MNNRVFMVIDLDRCWGCKACQVACKQELELDIGCNVIQVVDVGPRLIDGKLHNDSIPTMCQHCDKPSCMDVCPSSAIFKEKDGTVQINESLCIGCEACKDVCPYGAIEIADKKGSNVAVKCTLCLSRRKQNRLPSCMQHCIGRAFALAKEEELKDIIDKRYHWSTGSIVYVSSKWISLGSALNAK